MHSEYHSLCKLYSCCRNYGLSIYCGTKEDQTDQEHNSTWCCFSVHISVTEEGLENVDDVSRMFSSFSFNNSIQSVTCLTKNRSESAKTANLCIAWLYHTTLPISRYWIKPFKVTLCLLLLHDNDDHDNDTNDSGRSQSSKTAKLI